MVQTIILSQIKDEEEESVALISYGLMEEYGNSKLRKYPKYRAGTKQTKYHFGPLDILNGLMMHVKEDFNLTVLFLSYF